MSSEQSTIWLVSWPRTASFWKAALKAVWILFWLPVIPDVHISVKVAFRVCWRVVRTDERLPFASCPGVASELRE